MIGGLFYVDQMIEISQHNKRVYNQDNIKKRVVHVETWLRSTGWTRLNLALCRKSKKGLYVMLPASCVEAITTMKEGDPITRTLVKERFEPHLMRGSRLFDYSDFPKAKEWANNALLVRCVVILNPLHTDQDEVQLARMDCRIFPTCNVCSKELETCLFCSGCGVTCYCDTTCERNDLNTKHKKECVMMKTALEELESHYCRVTPPNSQRTLPN